MRATLLAAGGQLLVVLNLMLAGNMSADAAETLRVMTLNIWVGGESSGQPLSQIAKVIETARAEVVGLQETHGEERNGKKNDAARRIAEQLGWHYFDQGDDDCGVISRYKIVGHTPKKWGVALELPSGRRAWLFNAHLMHTPYQPYQLLKIPYNDAPFITTEAEAIDEARKARAEQVAAMLQEIDEVRGEGTLIFVTGDFNEPSSLDWIAAVAEAGRCPIAVHWPTTAAILGAGFVDAYRQAHPDPLESPGYTWTPTTAEVDPHDRHDRIDFVLVAGPKFKVTAAEVVGEKSERAEIVVAPYPSDHRGVVATIELE